MISIGLVIGGIAALTTGSYWFGAGIALAAGAIVWRSAILGTDKVEGNDKSIETYMRDRPSGHDSTFGT
ncbi:MAG TPA: hypothetical protein VIF14_08685 [Alphaproteobacteria bacterium]